MRKMLVAERSEMNRSIIYDSFASQYELLQTESSEEVFRLLMDNKNSLSIVLISENIASHITAEAAKTLSVLKVFENVPVVIILEGDSSGIKQQKFHLPFSDVVNSPVNPYIIKKRVANLVELFSHKSELEELVNDQTKKILEQNIELQIQQKKINTINNDMLDTLSTVIEYRDVESGRHIHRIRKFTEALLRVLAEKYPKYNLTEEKIELITSASSIHDIGKIAIPDSILLSPRRLSYDEFKLMKQHTTKGCEILDQLDAVEKNEYFKYCYDICRYHHEKWDGQGYPDGLVGDQIPIWAQVVSLADCYDALTSDRPYKAAFTHEQAVEMIRDGACGTFSDEMMDCFSAVLPKFKELAIEYADINNEDTSISDKACHETVSSIDDEDAERSVYLKMDRKDLISTIENQKLMLEEGNRHNHEILYKNSDFVFEFDLKRDILHERKGSMKDICGYIPKNYEEAVNILSECCQGEYAKRFVRSFRLPAVRDSVECGDENVCLECYMELDEDDVFSVRCTAVPVTEGGDIVRIFFVIIKLHDSVIDDEPGADRDVVTGLWNYSGVRREISDYLENTGNKGYHALLLIDIDDFRAFNKQVPHLFANDILRDIAKQLKNEITYGNVIGRIDDDNFLVFINDCPDKEDRDVLIEDIFKCIRSTYSTEGENMPEISSSIGVALYPADGRDFNELYYNASRAVEVAKLNGKNMYLYYNKRMRDNWEIKRYDSDVSVKDSSGIELIDFEEYFIPVSDSVSGQVTSYDIIEVSGDLVMGVDTIFDEIGFDSNITALSINNLSRLFSSMYDLQQESNKALPEISVFTMFEGRYTELVLNAVDELLKNYPLQSRNITVMLSQTMLESMSVNEITGFASSLKKYGFKVGVYNVGVNNIHINCFIDKLFSRVVFAKRFVQSVFDGVYNIDYLVGLIDSFDRSGVRAVLPGGIDEEFINTIRLRTHSPFGIHKEDVISLADFKMQMQSAQRPVEYPVLSHENTDLVLNDKLYDEILEQTRSFILEWAPRFDNIKISGSFESMYGYLPETDDFVRNIKESKLIHPDDVKKLLEKMNSARSDSNESEAFIRVYSQKSDMYIWNRVRFVTLKNAAQIPVKIISVFTDISDDRAGTEDEARKDRTDFITNLYNKHATENKIKNYLYDEGSSSSHAFLVVEVGGFEALESNLGTVFANAVLKEAAHNIRELFRDSDIIGRSSGNRFTVFIKGMSTKEKITEKAQHICEIIDNKYQCDNGDVSIYGNVGISIFPNNGTTYDDLYSGALKALYFAKHNVKQNVAFVSDAEPTKLLHS